MLPNRLVIAPGSYVNAFFSFRSVRLLALVVAGCALLFAGYVAAPAPAAKKPPKKTCVKKTTKSKAPKCPTTTKAKKPSAQLVVNAATTTSRTSDSDQEDGA